MLSLTKKLKLEDFNYSIILSVENMNSYPKKPNPKDKWSRTEKEENYQEVENLFHKKFVGILTFEEFDNFCWDYGCYYSCETGGSIGALGFGLGWSPAIAFTNIGNAYYDDEPCMDLYITPINPKRKKQKLKELDKIFELLIEKYD